MKKKKEIIIEQSITVGNKRYPYTLKSIGNGETFITCKAARIAQEFLDEDILSFIMELPNLIIAEKEYQKAQSQVLRFRCTDQERRAIEKRALEKQFKTVSAYLRALALQGEITPSAKPVFLQ